MSVAGASSSASESARAGAETGTGGTSTTREMPGTIAVGGFPATGGDANGPIGGCAPITFNGIDQNPACTSQADCEGRGPMASYCDPTSCSHLACVGNRWVDTDACIRLCRQFPTCPDATFLRDATKEACVVVVRVDAASQEISSYALHCADPNSLTEHEAFNLLSSMSSISWSSAVPIANAPILSQIYAFRVHEGGHTYTAYISAATGDSLLVTDDAQSGAPGDFRSTLDWRPASELGTACALEAPQIAVPLELSSDIELDTAANAVFMTALMSTMKAHFISVGPFVVSPLDQARSAYLVFMTGVATKFL